MSTPYAKALNSQCDRMDQELLTALEGGSDTLNEYLESQSQLDWSREGCVFYIALDTLVYQQGVWYNVSESQPLIQQGLLCPENGLHLDKINRYQAFALNNLLDTAQHIVEGWWSHQQ